MGTKRAELATLSGTLERQELDKAAKAKQMADSKESVAVFTNSSSTLFLQVSSDRRVGSRGIAALQNIAKMYRSGAVAKIATAATTRGFFDKVIADIDSMIALLRKEGAMDIEHRDRCQSAENKNSNDVEDIRRDAQKANAAIESLRGEETDLQAQIKQLGYEIGNSTQDKKDLLAMRTTENDKFKTALEADARAAELITKA